MLNWPVDYLIYPVWIGYIFATGRQKYFEWGAQERFLVMMYVWMVISVAVNGLTDANQIILRDYFKFIVLYFLVSATVNDLPRLKIAAKIVLFFGLLLSVEGIMHKLSPDHIGWAGQSLGWIDPAVLAAGGSGRTEWVGIFDGPGVFAVIYTTALPFILQYYFKPYSKFVNVIAILLTALICVAIYYNGSRGGLLATLTIFALFFAYRYKVKSSTIIQVSILAVLVLVAAPSHMTTVHDSSNSSAHRIDMWAEGIEMAQYDPMLGIGKGNFKRYTSRLIAHNSAIEIMGETGLVGLFFWLGIIYMALKKVLIYLRLVPESPYRSLVAATGIAVTGYIVSSMFVTLEYETLYVLLALTTPIGKQFPDKHQYTKADFKRMIFIIIGFILVMKTVITLFNAAL